MVIPYRDGVLITISKGTKRRWNYVEGKFEFVGS